MSLGRTGARTALVAAACAVGLLAGAASALAEQAKFTFTGSEQEFKVPAGVTSLRVEAVGSRGESAAGFRGEGGVGAGAGGVGAVVTGTLSVTSGQALYVEVGGTHPPCSPPIIPCVPGFNGGGLSVIGGGGGGASDVRTVPIGAGPSPGNEASLNSRLLVAAGGGGGGFEDFGKHGCAGGAGGAAEEKGANGASCGYPGAGGGGAGEANKGGAGGAGYNGLQPFSFFDGEAGRLGAGGRGGPIEQPESGGGGGGRYGGGGGGEQNTDSSTNHSGEGGGGGGSNLVPEGGKATLANAGAAASVTFTYATPPLPDLSLQNIALPSPVLSGNTLTYTITVTNTGAETASGVELKDTLPGTGVFKSMNTTQGACNRTTATNPKANGGPLVSCNLGSLEADKTATITIAETATKPGIVNAQAAVTASNVESDRNDEATATTPVLGH